MNLNNLYYFIIVAEEMSFTKAANRLYISQQAVSSHIKSLETELGVSLFDRKPILSLTPVGESFYKMAIDIMNLQQDFLKTVSTPFTVAIRLGLSYGRSKLFGPGLLALLKKEHPNISLSIVEKPSTVFLEQSILTDELDFFFGISPIRSPDITSIEISSEPMYLIFSKKFCSTDVIQRISGMAEPSISEKTGIPLSAFAAMPFLLPSNENAFRFMFNKYVGDIHFVPNIIFESSQLDNLFFMAIDGMGITVYPKSLLNYQKNHLAPEVSGSIIALPLTDCVSSKIVLSYNRSRHLSPSDTALIDTCKKIQYLY